jgi:RNA polymerase sigma-70 factor (ECF subfamily)
MQEKPEEFIHLCIRGDRSAQSRLYVFFAPKMFAVCLRYSRSREEAEEILQEGFIKLFASLQQFKHEGSFEGWVRKIMVNCALQRFRGKSALQAVVNINAIEEHHAGGDDATAMLGTKELLKLVQNLPASYRMVFNLYVFEGLKHREISSLLGISEGTSKSNLADARAILQKWIKKDKLIAKKLTV